MVKHPHKGYVAPSRQVSTATLEDITNTCHYLIYPRYTGGIFYCIQAEHKTCYLSVATIIDGELKTSPGLPDIYKIKFEEGELKIYRRGPMPY